MKSHTHHMVAKHHEIVGWTHCVAGRACDGRAHGAVVIVDKCSCGAERRIESHGQYRVSSGWVGETDEDS